MSKRKFAADETPPNPLQDGNMVVAHQTGARLGTFSWKTKEGGDCHDTLMNAIAKHGPKWNFIFEHYFKEHFSDRLCPSKLQNHFNDCVKRMFF